MFSSLLFVAIHLVLVVQVVHSEDVSNNSSKVKYLEKTHLKKSLWKECSASYSLTCFKLDVITWVDKMNEQDTLSLLPGLSLVRETNSARLNSADEMEELSRDFPSDSNGRLDAYLLNKIASYLNTHSLRLDLLNKDMVESARGRGGKKGGGGMGMMLAAGAMMKGLLLALALGGITAIAGKALMAGLISLLLSGIVGLKSLSSGHKSTTYEVVAKPVHSHSVSHSESHDQGHYGHSSYGRSLDLPALLALNPNI